MLCLQLTLKLSSSEGVSCFSLMPLMPGQQATLHPTPNESKLMRKAPEGERLRRGFV